MSRHDRELTASAPGYVTRTFTRQVRAGVTTWASLGLRRDPTLDSDGDSVVDLQDNDISNLGPLAGLDLLALSLTRNSISDLAPLGLADPERPGGTLEIRGKAAGPAANPAVDGVATLSDAAPRMKVIKVVEPPKRKAGVKVESAAELVDKLKNEAKVI